MTTFDSGFWRGKRVLVTGHSGFKGWWLSQWLEIMGSEVAGFSNAASQTYASRPFLLEHGIHHTEQIGDIRDTNQIQDALFQFKPQIVFHLAAQPSVIEGYQDPVMTWGTNLIGTANLLFSASQMKPSPTIVVATTDKVYENDGRPRSYVEAHPLGYVADPYSASKAFSDKLAQSFSKGLAENSCGNFSVAVARAGNVIGGGDWLARRIIPDAVRAFVEKSNLFLRNPNATRPYQHILDVIFGYLTLAQNIFNHKIANSEVFNFGPKSDEQVTTEQLCRRFFVHFPSAPHIEYEESEFSEQTFLSLNSSKALNLLGWSSRIDLDLALKLTASWYQNVFQGFNARDLTQQQINWYMENL